nr:adenylosuccinate synthetase [Marinitoga lauensis]
MERVAIVGAQWGDEGKGKVVNYFSKNYEWIVRFSGGANAGHTIYYKGKKYVNHLLPSVIPEGNSKAFLGAGMVIDIEQLIKELEILEKDFPGFSSKVYIDLEAFMVLPYHKEEDGILEKLRKNPIGTTKKGIGPSYTDKVSREGFKIYHLFDEKLLKNRLEEVIYLKRNIFGNKFKFKVEEIFDYLMEQKKKLEKMNVNFTSAIDMADVFRNTSVLFEGAQGFY